MNDLIENSPDEVICLLLSLFGRLQMKPQFCDFLDGTSGVVLRICSFVQETISSWIRTINDVAQGNSSSTQIDEAKLALLWGVISCCPYIMDVQAESSLLMDLIDALHLLLMHETGKKSFLVNTQLSSSLYGS